MWYNVYWIDWIGGDFTKINLTGYIKDKYNKETFQTKGIKNKKNISYQIDNYKYKLKIIDSQIILIRENKDIKSILLFEKNKEIPATYTIKDNNISIEINIKTNKIEIKDNSIKINYLILDSNEEYEYYIEMSEY